MREYVVVPPALLADRPVLQSWVSKALAYGGSLEPKAAQAGRGAARKTKASGPARRRS